MSLFSLCPECSDVLPHRHLSNEAKIFLQIAYFNIVRYFLPAAHRSANKSATSIRDTISLKDFQKQCFSGMESSDDSHHLAFVDFKIQPSKRRIILLFINRSQTDQFILHQTAPFSSEEIPRQRFRCQKNFLQKGHIPSQTAVGFFC